MPNPLKRQPPKQSPLRPRNRPGQPSSADDPPSPRSNPPQEEASGRTFYTLPTEYRNSAVAVAKRLKQDPQVSYVLGQLRKGLHRSGGSPLSVEEEQALFDEVTRTLLASPDVLNALRQIQQS